MTFALHFEVIGHPEPAGSKRAVPIQRKAGGGWVSSGTRVIDANPRVIGWRTEVARAAYAAMLGQPDGPVLVTGPVGLAVVFTLTRPKGHFGTGRNANRIKDSAPGWPCVKPDCTKLLRGVEDAMTGVVYHDDAQVVEQMVTKVYGHPERVEIRVWSL